MRLNNTLVCSDFAEAFSSCASREDYALFCDARVSGKIEFAQYGRLKIAFERGLCNATFFIWAVQGRDFAEFKNFARDAGKDGCKILIGRTYKEYMPKVAEKVGCDVHDDGEFKTLIYEVE